MPPPPSRNPDRTVLIGLLLTAAVYCRDLRYDFILDDVPLILTNQTIASWHNWTRVFLTDIFSAGGTDVPQKVLAIHYRPVYVLWLMLNSQLFSAVLPWWHLTSLLLHLVVTLLVYRLAIRMLNDSWAAALAALLFAFHPVHVESVSYVTASTDLLVTLFLLAAFLCYSEFRERAASPAYFVLSLFAAALAMLSKETAAAFPALLVAYEALPRASRNDAPGRKRFLWTLPFFAIVAAYAAVRAQLFGFNAGPGPGGSRLATLTDAPLVLLVYLRNLVWPARLSFYYPVEWSAQWSVGKLCATLIVLAVAVWLWRRYRENPGVRLQLLWTVLLFIIPLASVSAFVREDWVHDRHMYLVSVPVCLLAARLLMDAKLPLQANPVRLRQWAAALALLILLGGTFTGVPRFADGETIYATALQVDPDSAVVRSQYASTLWTDGHRDEALLQYRLTTERSPRLASAHENYGAALAQLGRDEEAAAEFALALRWTPEQSSFRAFVLYELATIELKHAAVAQAATHARNAIQIAPQAVSYHALLAQALQQQGQTQEAGKQMQLEAALRNQLTRSTPTRP